MLAEVLRLFFILILYYYLDWVVTLEADKTVMEGKC